MSQHELFAASEADAWFSRNAGALGDPAGPNDPVLRLLRQAGVEPRRVLEVGCANGYRLASLRASYGCEAVGCEPSPAALEDGRRRFPEVAFHPGLVHSLGFEDGAFDLVIANFVLHWVDRAYLLRSAAEIDRVLADLGVLAVGDFLPAGPQKVPYHHRPDRDVYTFKQDYAEIWKSTRLYEEMASCTLDHRTMEVGAEVPPEERVVVTLLRKSLVGNYRGAPLPPGLSGVRQ